MLCLVFQTSSKSVYNIPTQNMIFQFFSNGLKLLSRSVYRWSSRVCCRVDFFWTEKGCEVIQQMAVLSAIAPPVGLCNFHMVWLVCFGHMTKHQDHLGGEVRHYWDFQSQYTVWLRPYFTKKKYFLNSPTMVACVNIHRKICHWPLGDAHCTFQHLAKLNTS